MLYWTQLILVIQGWHAESELSSSVTSERDSSERDSSERDSSERNSSEDGLLMWMTDVTGTKSSLMLVSECNENIDLLAGIFLSGASRSSLSSAFSTVV